ncbi:MAG: esterase family protein [Oscillospiraceae bacterium]|jgi:S-formylglutathione hydrolase FrmB|nr:esterase family protein [Oscillospiraceae bacterium]
MAFFMGTIDSLVMELKTQLVAILPEYPDPEKPLKALYLLHGLRGNALSWVSDTSIERYVKDRNWAVIMPEVGRSFYQDMKYGPQYFTYVSEELPKICKNMFGLDPSRENTFVAGLSMGGYGALRIGLAKPDKFAALASLSGVTDIKAICQMVAESDLKREKNDFLAAIGSFDEIRPEIDIYHLLGEVEKLDGSQRPKIYLTCGKQDFLCPMNKAFNDRLKNSSVDFLYEEFDGDHVWAYWDFAIQRALDYFDSIA